MKKLSSLTVVAILFIFACALRTLAEDTHPDTETNKNLVESQNQIIKLTDSGPQPAELRMRVDDSILFFLNDTRASLTSVVIDFGEKTIHCASTNMDISSSGKISSKKPFAPRDFSSVCFHQAGTYPVTIYGVGNKSQVQTAKIIVE